MKIGLEHTIRNVISESLGGGITTDKPQKVGKAFFKSVHIEPKKGEEHVNGSSSVRAAINAQVQSSSSNVKEDAQLDEFVGVVPALKTAGKAVAPYVDDAVKMLDDLFKTKPAVKPKLPEVPVTPKPSAPAVKPKPPEVSPIPTKPTEAPKPNAPEVKPEVKPSTKTKTIPTPSETPTAKPANKLKKEPSPAETPATKPATGTSGNGSQNKTRKGETEDKKEKRFPFPTLTIYPVPLTSGGAYVPVDTYTHIAQERRTYGESTDADEKRENIEVVARPKNKNRTRQAEIIRKIIEEKRTKKKKTLSTVEINPQLNPEEPDKN